MSALCQKNPDRKLSAASDRNLYRVGNRKSAMEIVQQPPGAPALDLVFADGFETGDLPEWGDSETDGGALSATTAAALVGTYGMQADLDGLASTDPQYVLDDSPNAENYYRVRFYFDPNDLLMEEGDSHMIFYGYDGDDYYSLRAGLLDDTENWINSTWITVDDAPHVVELVWQAATVLGCLAQWVDEMQEEVTGITNAAWRIDSVRLGVVGELDEGTSGAQYIDAFESRRATTIEYEYDPLYRLKEANYSDGRYFHYTYDAVGNRLSEEKCRDIGGCTTPITTNYTYDEANRLTLVWLFLKHTNQLEPDELHLRDQLLAHPILATARKLAHDFQRLVRQRKPRSLNRWLAVCETASIPELANLAAGILQDYSAVKAALTLKWSNGQTEGQVNRLKLLKRQIRSAPPTLSASS